MKKLRLISLVLVLVLMVGVFAGCKKGSSDKVIWLVSGTEGPDTPEVINKVISRIKEETGLTVEFKYIDDSQYDLQFSSGEPFDLVWAPDWKGYWQNVEKGAFAEITEEDYKKYAPYIWENGKKYLEASKFDGKYYGIVGIRDYSPDRLLVARGDLMDKYGIDALNTIEDVDKFVNAVADDKTNDGALLAFNAPGNAPWMIFNMWASDWGWGGVGSLSFGEHIYYDTDEDYQKLFVAIDRPEVKEYSENVKGWYDKGIFSKSILSNETSAEEALKNGKSALAWTSSPSSANALYKELQADERKSYDVRFYSMYARQQRMYGYMNSNTSINAKSKNKEGALKVMNAVYANEDIYMLLTKGIEGKHYEFSKDGGFIDLNTDASYQGPVISISNDAYNVTTDYVYPYAEDLVAELKGKSLEDPLVNCVVAAPDEIAVIKTQLSEVFSEYCFARMYGAVDNVDKAIANEKKALKAAGIDKWLAHNQKCVDEYVKNNPEAIKRYEEGKKKVAKWNEEHPTKTNPKDYK